MPQASGPYEGSPTCSSPTCRWPGGSRRPGIIWGCKTPLPRGRRAPELGADVLAVGGGHAVFLGSGSPLSQAQGLGLNGPVAEGELARMEQFFKDRDTQAQVEVASLADPSLLASLSLRGYLIAEQTHSLVCPLEHAAWGEPGRPPSRSSGALEILRVGTDALEHWVDVVLGCFFQEPDEPPALVARGGDFHGHGTRASPPGSHASKASPPAEDR